MRPLAACHRLQLSDWPIRLTRGNLQQPEIVVQQCSHFLRLIEPGIEPHLAILGLYRVEIEQASRRHRPNASRLIADNEVAEALIGMFAGQHECNWSSGWLDADCTQLLLNLVERQFTVGKRLEYATMNGLQPLHERLVGIIAKHKGYPIYESPQDGLRLHAMAIIKEGPYQNGRIAAQVGNQSGKCSQSNDKIGRACTARDFIQSLSDEILGHPSKHAFPRIEAGAGYQPLKRQSRCRR